MSIWKASARSVAAVGTEKDIEVGEQAVGKTRNAARELGCSPLSSRLSVFATRVDYISKA